MKYTISYLPPEYLAMKDTMNDHSITYNKAIKDYLHNRTFRLKIEEEGQPESQFKSDLNFKGVQNFEEYSERFYSMNFYMDEYISMKIENAEYSPVLYNTVNTYGISPDMSVIFVFAKNGSEKERLNQSGNLTIIFRDKIFNNGKLMFSFKESDLDYFSNN